jgi:hypothetical protein
MFGKFMLATTDYISQWQSTGIRLILPRSPDMGGSTYPVPGHLDGLPDCRTNGLKEGC